MTRRYGIALPGLPQGIREDVELCIVAVVRDQQTHAWSWGQCKRSRGHGPGGLYCKQHLAMLAKGRSLWIPADKADDD